MAVIKDGYEYTLPLEVDNRIPYEFYHAMAGELLSVFGWDKLPCYFERGEYFYELDCGSIGWSAAFFAACRKLNLLWLYKYRSCLKWYEVDLFDSIIEDRIIQKAVIEPAQDANPYYLKVIKWMRDFNFENFTLPKLLVK